MSITYTEPVFADLPASKMGPRDPAVWRDRLAPLIERPGQWAQIASAPKQGSISGTASLIKHKGAGGFPPGMFEAVTRTTDTGCGLWVRYVGAPALTQVA